MLVQPVDPSEAAKDKILLPYDPPILEVDTQESVTTDITGTNETATAF
jgi:hypothetical protein